MTSLSQLHILQQYYRTAVERDCLRAQIEKAKSTDHMRGSGEIALLRMLGHELFGEPDKLIGIEPKATRNDLIQRRVRTLRALEGESHDPR